MPGEKKVSPQSSNPQAQSSKPQAAQGEAFVKHLENASNVVRNWPTWKQQVLGGAATNQSSNPNR